jgi:hypothetical protein
LRNPTKKESGSGDQSAGRSHESAALDPALANPTVIDRYRSKIVNAPDSDWPWWTGDLMLCDSHSPQTGTTPSESVNSPRPPK